MNSGRFFSSSFKGRFVIRATVFMQGFEVAVKLFAGSSNDPGVVFVLLVERGDDQNFRMLRRKPHLTLCDKYVIFAVVFQAPMVFVLSDSKRDFPGRRDRGESHISLWLDDRWVSV